MSKKTDSTKALTASIKNEVDLIKSDIVATSQINMINGEPLADFMYQHFLNRIDPVEYCESVLRAHLPEKKRSLHENQTTLIRAVCNPKLKRVAGMMARQCIAEHSIIHTRDGQLIPIEKYEDAWLTITDAEVFEVVTQDGHQVIGTANHPIKSDKGWTKIEDLKEGDKIYCLQQWNKFSKTNSISDETVQCVGLMTSIWFDKDTFTTPFSDFAFTPELYAYAQFDRYGIPRILNRFTKRQTRLFFKTLCKCDGTTHPNILHSKNRVYADFMHQLLNKLGIFTEIVKVNIGEDSVYDLVWKETHAHKTVQEKDGEELYLDTITSIKPAGRVDVYDTSFPNKGWFICGGIQVHNSGKTESIASFCGFLADNYPQMQIGIFTPRLQQAEISVGRLSTMYQMNDDKMNNKLLKVTKDRIELSNGSFISAVSASDQSNIEGLTFDIIVLDEAQKVSDYTFSERILPIGTGCIHANSLIPLYDGTYQTIEEIVKKKKVRDIPCIDFDNKKITNGHIIDYCDNGYKDSIKITFSSGKTLIGTHEHPIICHDRKDRKLHWKRLDELQEGMRVAVPYTLPFFGQHNEPYARFLGMMIGDGTYHEKIEYGTKDNELIKYLGKLFSTDLRTIYSYTTKSGEDFYICNIRNSSSILKKAKIYGQFGLYKTLPYNWQSYDKESLCDLIGGLFDTDGCVVVNSKDSPNIRFSSICRAITDNVQRILERFGVHSSISVHKSHKHDFNNGKVSTCSDCFVLVVIGKENISNFYNNFHFLIKSKQQKLEKAMRVLNVRKTKLQSDFIDTDIRFERIIKIEDVGKQHVYDLVVDTYHSFIANNIFVHNTNAKIVQIGTPKTRNHFYDAIEGKAKNEWLTVRRDWTQCPQSWALDAIYLPDPETGIERPYSRFIIETNMPKVLKEEMFPNNPEVWTDGIMSVQDFKTQYMLEFIDGAGKYLTMKDVENMSNGEFDWLEHGRIGETYVAGIDFAGSNPDGDSTHITVLRITKENVKQKVFCMEFNDVPYPQQIYEIAHMFGGPTPRFEVKKIIADYTGCGAPIVQMLQSEYGLKNLEGIIFNSRDKYTHSGMNMKNLMYSKWRAELDNGRFKYPSKERFEQSDMPSAGKKNIALYYHMLSEWADLECAVSNTINKKIEAPKDYHDDVCDADVLATFASMADSRRSMPRVRIARTFTRSW